MSLEIQGINKSWGGVQVLEEVDLAVPTDRITGLIGPNGAGKSTLFGVVAGNVTPDSGEVHFQGQSISRLDIRARSRTGLIRTFQIPRPFINLTVRENLAVASADQPGETITNVFFRALRTRSHEKQVMEKVEQVIETLKLGAVANSNATELSGGQLKLLELGRLLMTNPRLILLDEPFAGVNPVLCEALSMRITELAATGIGFFIVEHNLALLSRLAPCIHAMDQGRIIAGGTPDEVLSNREVRASYVGGSA